MRSWMRRRSTSNCDSPSPRIPMPPFCRERCVHIRVNRGKMCCSWAISICILPSRVRARWAKMSRISAVRSSTLQSKSRSKLRVCAGLNSSSKITVSTSPCFASSANSLALPLPMNVATWGRSSFCVPSPMMVAPAVVASSASSAIDSLTSKAFPCLSSTPTRKTRSVFPSCSARDFTGQCGNGSKCVGRFRRALRPPTHTGSPLPAVGGTTSSVVVRIAMSGI